MEHVDYPHEPGYLYDCLACEAECHCGETHDETCTHPMNDGKLYHTTQCVYSGDHAYTEASTHVTQAAEIGARHGKAAASWFFDGNTSTETYRRILAGIEDHDPEILDSLPSHGLSGEMADGYSSRDLERELGIDPDTETEDFGDISDAYETAFNEAVQHEIERIARLHLES